jgi:hypothetical protein
VKRNDGETDQLLKLIVGLVVVVASVCLGFAFADAQFDEDSLVYAAAGVAVAVAAGGPSFKIRIRSQVKFMSSWSAAVVLSVALLQPPWAVICIAVAATVVNMATRLQPIKIAFNTAKDIVAASAAVVAAAAVAAGAGPGTTVPTPRTTPTPPPRTPRTTSTPPRRPR